MVAVPAAIPVTTPEPVPTVATVVAADDHVPGVVALANVVLPPAHTVAVPVIVAGNGCTVTVTERAHMVDSVYCITVVPMSEAVTTPVAIPTEATAASLVLHTPPTGDDDKVVVLPSHTTNGGADIGEGSGLTVIVRVKTVGVIE